MLILSNFDAERFMSVFKETDPDKLEAKAEKIVRDVAASLKENFGNGLPDDAASLLQYVITVAGLLEARAANLRLKELARSRPRAGGGPA